jgi:hypothetical protein
LIPQNHDDDESSAGYDSDSANDSTDDDISSGLFEHIYSTKVTFVDDNNNFVMIDNQEEDLDSIANINNVLETGDGGTNSSVTVASIQVINNELIVQDADGNKLSNIPINPSSSQEHDPGNGIAISNHPDLNSKPAAIPT